MYLSLWKKNGSKVFCRSYNWRINLELIGEFLSWWVGNLMLYRDGLEPSPAFLAMNHYFLCRFILSESSEMMKPPRRYS